MKKYLRYANFLALGAGAVGMLLALWLFSAGTDEKGLYPAYHIAWVLLGILTAAVLVFFLLLSLHTGTNRNYKQNFPASIAGAVGCVLAAIGMLSGGITMLGSGKGLTMLTGAVGMVGSLPLLWAAACRLRGQRCKLPVHMLPCFFFTLRLFVLGQAYGSEPEAYRFLYCFAATVTMVPACYWLWSFDVNLGKRPDCVFWCLTAGYCNLVAAVSCQLALLHLGMAAWMLTALPKLCYLPKQFKTAATPSEETVTVPAEESPAVAEAPADAVVTRQTPDLPDADAILEELLRDFGQTENN